MKAVSKLRARVTLPTDLIEGVDRLVGKTNRAKFINDVIRLELMRRRQRAALEAAAGCWKEEDHPELKDGVDAWVRSLREEGEARFRRVTAED